MPARNSKGRFVKSGKARRATSGAITKYRTRTVTKYKTRHVKAKGTRRGRRRSAGGGSIRPLHLALASAGVAYLTSAKGPQTVKDMVNKVPGAKTFGAPAALGIACLAVDKFVKPNRWLKLAGYAGIVAAAMKVGEQGSSFKWVGDNEFDMAGDDDIADADDLEDVDDVADYEE